MSYTSNNLGGKMTGRIFTFFGHKGGVGKSMGAVHTAVRLIESDRNVVVADLDARQGDSVGFFKLRDQANIVESPVDLKALNVLMARCRKNDVDLVIDCPAADDELARRASAEADSLIIPFKPGANDLRAVGRAIRLSMRPARPEAQIFCWMNFADNTKDSARLHDILGGTGAFSFAGQVARRQAFNDAIHCGRTVWELGGDKKATAEMLNFCNTVLAATRKP